ncbi:hypothetical protein U1Q18_035884 [Sarracenia purpurea var. burkii]
MATMKIHAAAALLLLTMLCVNGTVFAVMAEEEEGYMNNEIAPSPAMFVAGAAFAPPISFAAFAFSVALYVIGVFVH